MARREDYTEREIRFLLDRERMRAWKASMVQSMASLARAGHQEFAQKALKMADNAMCQDIRFEDLVVPHVNEGYNPGDMRYFGSDRGLA
ncbi:MAG: hypothetical protein ACXABY_14075 [Candidatus Thorarchaeota archaeon]|jgi:hypothetical protein